MSINLLVGDCRATLATVDAGSVQACISSPAYWRQRDYGMAAQLGQEPTLDCAGWAIGTPCGQCYVCQLVGVYRLVRRALKDDGVCFINLGDGYSNAGQAGNDRRAGQATGGKTAYTPCGELGPKQLLGAPWRVALALQADGWILRQDIIWAKKAPMPESVTDRCTKAHEYIFLLAKQERYYFDTEAIKEPAIHAGRVVKAYGAGAKNLDGASATNDRRTAAGFGNHDTVVTDRNKRSVWTLGPEPYAGAHFATFPTALVETCLLASTRPGDTVLDPFAGSGTVGAVAVQWQRSAILCELNPAYAALAAQRIGGTQPALFVEEVA